MKENVLDVLMFLFENYLYDEPEEAPDRDSLEENLLQAGFTNEEIEKAFNWLDGLADQRHQPDLFQNNHRPIRVYVDSEMARLACWALTRSIESSRGLATASWMACFVISENSTR